MLVQIESTNYNTTYRKFMGFRHLIPYNQLMHKILQPGNIKLLELNIRDNITHEVIPRDMYC